MGSALYDSFIADYYDESPVVKGRLQDVAFYRDAARESAIPFWSWDAERGASRWRWRKRENASPGWISPSACWSGR